MAGIGSRGEMEAFVRSIELGGFSAAGRELGLTPSALSKLVTRLETRLEVRLLNRTTRKLAPTSEGGLFLERCRRILAEIEDAENELTRSRDRPRGRLRLHVGVAFGTHQMVPALPRFLERYSEVEVELIVDDRTVDLVKEGADIAVRTGPLRDSSLVARKLCDFERVICASPIYLARHGVPRSPDDLARHNCITIAGIPALARWSFDTPSGRRVIEVKGNVTANNAECVIQFALMGLGVIRMNEMAVGEEIRKGKLVPVLAESHHIELVPLHALYPPGRQRLPRIAAMLDFLLESFGHAPWRTAPAKAQRR